MKHLSVQCGLPPTPGHDHNLSQPSFSINNSFAEEAPYSRDGCSAQADLQWGKPSNIMLSNLAKKLQNVSNDYALEDDNPINYSLQYTELSSYPRENLRSKHADTAKSFISKPTTSGKDALINCQSYSNADCTDDNVEQKAMCVNNHGFESEDTPTNFGAIYTEEHLDERCLKDSEITKEVTDCVKTYHVEDTPICFSSRSSITDLHASGSKENEAKINHDEYPSDEADDKFDTGAITPAHYFSKSNRHSGLMTPRTPLFQDTPMMMYSPTESRSSLDSCDQGSIHSDVSSEPESRLQSGYVSASELPDSPGQSIPHSRSRSPINQAEAKQNKTATSEPSLRKLKGLELISKAHAMSAGYLATLPQKDEVKHFNAEPAMSVITGLSALSMDGEFEKIQPMLAIRDSNSNNNNRRVSDDGSIRVLQAGYVTSLPTSDEITHYYLEGSMSPLTGLSEISALCSHNEGFQCAFANTQVSNSNTSRSSATGASFPRPPISKQDKINSNSTSMKACQNHFAVE